MYYANIKFFSSTNFLNLYFRRIIHKVPGVLRWFVQSDNVEARHGHPHLKELGHYLFQSGNNLYFLFSIIFVLIVFFLLYSKCLSGVQN